MENNTPSRRIHNLGYLYHFLMIFVLTGAFIPIINKASGAKVDPYAGDPLTQIILVIGYALLIPYLFIFHRKLVQGFRNTFWIWVLVGLAFLSFLWSDVPLISLRKSISLFLLMVYGLILVLRFTLPEYFQLLGRVLLTILILSLVFIIFLPNLGIMNDQGLVGAWSGIFTHKHFLGFVCDLSVIFFIYLFRESTNSAKYLWLGGIILAIVLTIGARSMEALVGEIIIFMTALLLRLVRSKNWAAMIGLTLFAIAGVVLLLNYSNLLDLMGKSQTLTGRTPIWENAIALGLQKPWFGYGYKGFWLNSEGAVTSLVSTLGMNPGHSHNGYIDHFLDLGIVGICLALIILGGAFVKIIRVMTLEQEYSIEMETLLILFVNLVILNFVENHLFETNQLSTMFLLQMNYFGTLMLQSVVSKRRSLFLINEA